MICCDLIVPNTGMTYNVFGGTLNLARSHSYIHLADLAELIV